MTSDSADQPNAEQLAAQIDRLTRRIDSLQFWLDNLYRQAEKLAKHVTQQLRDIRDWNTALPQDALATYTKTSGIGTALHTGTPRDLSTIIATTVDAEDDGAHAIRTPAQITRWATTWATVADLHYAGNPLDALADNTPVLAQTFADWDALADDTAILHARIATLTGHAPIRLHPCPQPGCNGTITAPTTRNGISDYAWCDHCDTIVHTDPDEYADDIRKIAQNADNPHRPITAAEAAHLWAGELTVDQIKKWAAQGRLTPRATNPYSYDLDDIRTLIHERDTKHRNTH